MKSEDRPINLLKAGTGTWREGTYIPEGYNGGHPANYIPEGTPYCHGPRPKKGSLCPFWDRDEGRESQENGFCHLLDQGDWQMSIGLLWDQCKECYFNTEWEDEDDA